MFTHRDIKAMKRNLLLERCKDEGIIQGRNGEPLYTLTEKHLTTLIATKRVAKGV